MLDIKFKQFRKNTNYIQKDNYLSLLYKIKSVKQMKIGENQIGAFKN